MLEITRDPIVPDLVLEAVRGPGAGAVVSFLGVVRDHAEGRAVTGLEYEAYPEMAEAQFRLIADEIRQKWGITRVAIVHRVGYLTLEEIAVVIAVSSPHRKEAFEACHYAIDRIKEITPIWKKEFYQDGSEWKSG